MELSLECDGKDKGGMGSDINVNQTKSGPRWGPWADG